MTMTAERLAELDAVMAKATAGEWFYGIALAPSRGPVALDYEAPGYYDNTGILTATDTVVGCGECHIFNTPEDAGAIVALHNAYADLRAHIDAQAATIEELREALARIVASDSPLGRNGTPSHKEIARRTLKVFRHE